MWRRRCTPPDAQRPAQPRCFLLFLLRLAIPRVEFFFGCLRRDSCWVAASCGTRWGNIDGRSQPIKQKRAHPSVQFSTHNGSHGPILFFFLPAPSFSAQNVRVGALMAAGDKTVKDLGYLSKNQGMAAAMPRHTGMSFKTLACRKLKSFCSLWKWRRERLVCAGSGYKIEYGPILFISYLFLYFIRIRSRIRIVLVLLDKTVMNIDIIKM